MLSWPGQYLAQSLRTSTYSNLVELVYPIHLPYCLVRTGIPIPKATDSDSFIKPEPSEGRVHVPLAGGAGSNLFFRLLL